MSVFMHYEGIRGESSDHNHTDWIDIRKLEWGVKRKITSATSTTDDRESSNPEITDLILLRKMDSATPALFLESCCGIGKDVIIHMTKTGSGDGADVFVEYTLKNALISKYQMAAVAQDKSRPVEKLIISFVDLEVKYIPYDENGAPLTPIAVGYDTSRNRKH